MVRRYLKGDNVDLRITYIDFQILNFTRPEGGIRVSRTLSTSSRIPTDNAVKLNIWKSIDGVVGVKPFNTR